jgi:hypothetical protein
MSLIILSDTIIKGQTIIGSPIASSGLLLDTYSIVGAAYSLRKLRSSYTGHCIRVRRSSDNTTQDIGFDSNGLLDTTALTSFVGASTGVVTIWYDQSASGYNATTYGVLNPPVIVNAGALITLNGKIGLSFPGSHGLAGNGGSPCPNIMTSGLYSLFAVGNALDTSTRIMLQIAFGMQSQAIRRSGSFLQTIDATGPSDTGNVNPGTVQFIANTERKASSIEIFTSNSTNGATAAGAAISTNPAPLIGAYTNGSAFAWNGIIQEMIFFNINPAVITTYRTGVFTALNSYYGTY